MAPGLSMIGKPPSREVPAKLPLKQYPHLRALIREIEFICSNCSSGGDRVYISFKEARFEPLVAPPSTCTRFVVMCPMCQCVPASGAGGLITEGLLDLLSFPKGYKNPRRGKGGRGSVPRLSGDDGTDLDNDDGYEDAAEVIAAASPEPRKKPSRKPGRSNSKKKSDLNNGSPKAVKKRKPAKKKKVSKKR